jgi:hypothetical protein
MVGMGLKVIWDMSDYEPLTPSPEKAPEALAA